MKSNLKVLKFKVVHRELVNEMLTLKKIFNNQIGFNLLKDSCKKTGINIKKNVV